MNVYLGEVYKEVEYIQSSGTQYIDTGLLVKPDTEVQIDMQLTSVAANVRYFAVETGSSNWVAFVLYLDNNKQIAFANGNWSVLRTNRNGDTSRYTFVANNSSLKIYSNGTNIYTGNATGTRTTNSANNLYLLANDNNGTATSFSSAKLYSCKMYEGSTLVRDFIPCYRVSDNVIGLFDKVGNKFYTNAGTGSFTKGSDVKVFQPELKNAYIGEVVYCDFTQSDCGFTFFEKSGGTNVTSYGRNSNGFYVLPASGYYQQYASWKIPNNIYSKGTIKKAVFTINGQSTRNGCGFNTAGDAKRMRHYTAFRVIWGTQNSTGTSENSPANTDWTFTVDLENKLLSTSWSNITLSLTDNAISAFNTDWSAGNIAVQLLSYTDNTYSYLKNITFYF